MCPRRGRNTHLHSIEINVAGELTALHIRLLRTFGQVLKCVAPTGWITAGDWKDTHEFPKVVLGDLGHGDQVPRLVGPLMTLRRIAERGATFTTELDQLHVHLGALGLRETLHIIRHPRRHLKSRQLVLTGQVKVDVLELAWGELRHARR